MDKKEVALTLFPLMGIFAIMIVVAVLKGDKPFVPSQTLFPILFIIIGWIIWLNHYFSKKGEKNE